MDDPTASREPAPPGPASPEPAPPEPVLPEPARAYELPTARKVVGSGLQLALASTSDLRRASIYIGLLVLGAFGPTVIGVLLIFGRLGDAAGDALSALFLGSSNGAQAQPALEAALLIVALEALVGVLLFIAISVDAQVMGIAILGSRAGDRPMRLWEALTRARQTFWRVTGAGAVVGVAATVIQLLIVSALGGLSQSAEAADVVAAIIATVVIAPLAYVSTCIVLGDVGAMEALSRSWRLFRVRPRLAVAVVLFTLVTSAIQLFALSAGLDLVSRAGELLHVSLTEGALSFAVAVLLVLAGVVAYGSLTFTIGAVVAAPQVAGFLGLTFYSGGLDRARMASPKPPRSFRYVTRPMGIAMIALAGVVGLEIPAINSIEPPTPTPTAQFLRAEADAHEFLLSSIGDLEPIVDPEGDTGGGPRSTDIVLADAAVVPNVPNWLIDDTFSCTDPNVACGARPLTSTFDSGAYLFLLRAADGSSDLGACVPCAFGATLALSGQPRGTGEASYPGASIAFVATIDGAQRETTLRRWNGWEFYDDATHARARWSGPDRLILVPLSEIESDPVGWNMQTSTTIDGVESVDRLGQSQVMVPWEEPRDLWLDPASALSP